MSCCTDPHTCMYTELGLPFNMPTLPSLQESVYPMLRKEGSPIISLGGKRDHKGLKTEGVTY